MKGDAEKRKRGGVFHSRRKRKKGEDYGRCLDAPRRGGDNKMKCRATFPGNGWEWKLVVDKKKVDNVGTARTWVIAKVIQVL